MAGPETLLPAGPPPGSPGQAPLNLAAHTPGYDVTLERSETPEEQRARVRKEERRALIADWLWLGLGVFVALVIGLFLWVLFIKDTASPEQRELASKALLALIPATFSFILGRLSGK